MRERLQKIFDDIWSELVDGWEVDILWGLDKYEFERIARKALRDNPPEPKFDPNEWTPASEAETSPMWPQDDGTWNELRPWWFRGPDVGGGNHYPPARVDMVQRYAPGKFFAVGMKLTMDQAKEIGWEAGGRIDQEIPIEVGE